MKRAFCAWILAIFCLSSLTTLAETPSEEALLSVTAHRFTGAPVTKVPEEMKTVDTQGGVLLETPQLDLSKPDAPITGNNCEMVYNSFGDGTGYYKFNLTTNIKGAALISPKAGVTVKSNRNYLCSVLAWLDYDRICSNGEDSSEVIFYVRYLNADGLSVGERRCGATDFTDGWKRIEWIANPGYWTEPLTMQMVMSVQKVTVGMPEGNVCIADFSVVELPEETLVPYAEGEGVTFLGSAGALDMKVESADTVENGIVVSTTGTRYTFDTVQNVITAEQRIMKERVVATWTSNLPLTGLSVKSLTEKECVLTCPAVTFGVQMDGMVVMTPHKEDLRLTCTAAISGMWNRLAQGFLMVLDDYGGFTADPIIPRGTGDIPRCEVLTENLDFANYTFKNFRANLTEEQVIFHDAVSNAKPGWQMAWTISPGERLAITTFPPREYDWEQSFEQIYANSYRSYSPDRYTKYKDEYDISAVNLFNFSDLAYAMEWQQYYTQNVLGESFQAHIDRLKELDMQVLMYTSSYYYYSWEPEKYAAEVRRLKERYDIDGVYSDGQPYTGFWIEGYEEARLVREIFPDGIFIIHSTDMVPIGSASIMVPAVSTYAAQTLKGEGIAGEGLDWNIAKTANWTQYGGANCIGIAKTDAWKYVDENGETVKLPQGIIDLVGLEYNGRARFNRYDDYWKEYIRVLAELKTVWKEHGNDPEFYDKYYAPKARELTKGMLASYGDIETFSAGFEEEKELKEFGIYNIDATVSEDGGKNVLELSGARSYDKGSLLKRTWSVAGPMSIEYRFKMVERADYEHVFSDNYGNPAIGLCFGRDGRLKVRNVEGEYVNVKRFDRNRWYDVKVDVNTDTHTYTIYIDGEVITNGNLADSVYHMSDFEFFGGGYGSVCRIDDFKVINKA